ncbi:MAG TPA: hypothetical protein VFA68_03400 [Terriglobales bacterium]|nr:hypothetical protein [Terriglobales bacterium]
MNRIGLLLLFSIVSTISFAQSAAQPPAPPQTARQALLEMFTGAKENSFEKHLPEAAVHTLIRKGSNRQTSWVGQLSMFARMAQTPGSHLETFDVGSLLLSFEQNSGREKLELMVEHDDLQGDEDQIELSVRAYENGDLQVLPVVPRFIFAMRNEKDIWRLAKVTVQGEFPLTDPDYLKGLRDRENKSLESMAQYSVQRVVQAENSYASKYPEHGYSCNLGDLFSSTYKEGEAQFFSPELARGELNEYRISLAGCNPAPASKFQITAVPLDPDAGLKVFAPINQEPYVP